MERVPLMPHIAMSDRTTPPSHGRDHEEVDEIRETNENDEDDDGVHIKQEMSSTISSIDESPHSFAPSVASKPSYEWHDQREQVYAAMSVEEWRQKGRQLAKRTAVFVERVEKHQRTKQEKLQRLQQIVDQHLASLDYHERKVRGQLDQVHAWSMQLPTLHP